MKKTAEDAVIREEIEFRVAGAALGAVIYYFTDEFDYCDGKSLREWLKEGAE